MAEEVVPEAVAGEGGQGDRGRVGGLLGGRERVVGRNDHSVTKIRVSI